MRSRYIWMIRAAVCAAFVQSSAAPQSAPDSAARAREYVQFLVQQLDQWTRDFPQAYNMALVRPPVDAAQLTEAAKAAAGNLRAAVGQLAARSEAAALPNGELQSGDLQSNPAFRTQLEKALAAAVPLNAALGAQRFPEAIQRDWVSIRTTMNSLAGIYKISELAVLEAPGAGSPKQGKKALAAAVPPGSVTGYVVDQRCAARGKAMWTNVQCVQTCVRDGDKVVLVSEEGKVLQIANQDKIDAESYGQKVAITGKSAGGTITIATLQIL